MSNKPRYILSNENILKPILPTGCLVYLDFSYQYNDDMFKDTTLNWSSNYVFISLKNFLYGESSGFDNGLIFDGVDDYVDLGTLLTDRHNLTFFTEIYNYQGGTIFSEDLGAGFGFTFTESSTTYNIARYNTNGVPKYLFYIPKATLQGKNFKLCITIKDNVCKCYINGELYETNSNLDIMSVNSANNRRFLLGRGGSYSNTYWGKYKMKRFGVWNRDLSEQEIVEISNM